MKIVFAALLSLFVVTSNILLLLTNLYLDISYHGPLKQYAFDALGYVKNGDRSKIEIFTENEISHLNDVRSLVGKTIVINQLSFASIFLIFIYSVHEKKMHDLLKSVFFGGLFLLLITTISLIATTIFFQKFFIEFHKIFFPNGNWSFPSSSMLIILFPENFWFNAAKHLIFLMLIESAILILSFLKYRKG